MSNLERHNDADVESTPLLDQEPNRPTNTTVVVSNVERMSNPDNHPLLKACSCKSKSCDAASFTENMRISIHKEFWRLTYDDRKQWIFSHVEEVQPARRYVETNENRKPRITRRYRLPLNNIQTRVCQVCF